MSLVFRRARGGRLEIGPTPLSRLLAHRQSSRRDKEAGGALVGRHLKGGNDVIVDGATLPMPGDRRTRVSFQRRASGHAAAIDLAWQVSEGTQTYLGEWHTHPELRPSPSRTDFRDWSRKLHEDEYSGVLFFVIVGTEEISAWEGDPSGEVIVLHKLR